MSRRAVKGGARAALRKNASWREAAGGTSKALQGGSPDLVRGAPPTDRGGNHTPYEVERADLKINKAGPNFQRLIGCYWPQA